MRTPQQALQDAIESGAVAAFIAGKEIKFKLLEIDKWNTFNAQHEPAFAAPEYQWRPTPITILSPPPNESWHNPDNLTPEQVGEGYRLLLVSEIKQRQKTDYRIEQLQPSGNWQGPRKAYDKPSTYRVPLSTPFHWDAPKRIPLAPEDFIGAWLEMGSDYRPVTGVHPRLEKSIATHGNSFTVQSLIDMEVKVRLANTTNFRLCFNEVPQ